MMVSDYGSYEAHETVYSWGIFIYRFCSIYLYIWNVVIHGKGVYVASLVSSQYEIQYNDGTSYDERCARIRHKKQGQVITSHIICIM